MGPSDRRYQGEIIEWSDEKRCGFVRPRGSGAHDPVVFLSQSAFLSGKRGPLVGDNVTYEIEQVADTGSNRRLRTRLRAKRVVFAGTDVPRSVSKGTESLVCVLGVADIAAVALAMLLTQTQPWPLLWTMAVSVVAFATIWLDKRLAARATSRIPENTLLMLALLGGWPGSALAQTWTRHKTIKEPFRTRFRWTIAANVALSLLVLLGYLASKPLHSL